MKYLICLALLPAALFSNTYHSDCHFDDHLEHKRMLLIESSINHIEKIIEKNADVIPFNDFQDLIYHLYILENII
jgi:hypothetical protein